MCASPCPKPRRPPRTTSPGYGRAEPTNKPYWQSLQAVGRPPAGTRWVVVANRGADIYDYLRQRHTQGMSFIVWAPGPDPGGGAG